MPASATSTAAAAVQTAVRFRRAHRRGPAGERLAPGGHRLVGQPALDVLGQRPGTSGSGPRLQAIAFRQIASSAGSMVGSSCRGRGNSPRLHPAQHLAESSPSNGGWPVSRQ